MADQGGGNSMITREYKKGNWTLDETMVLIEAKRMDDERRMKRSSESSEGGGGRTKPAELRWKWVEDYCWRKACLRSQNQCNDKWDNLMRDYKKVREYERRIAEGGGGGGVSYWRMEKSERKEKNLPSNMLLQIYEVLVKVVERRGSSANQRMVVGSGGGGGGSGSVNPSICSSSVQASPLPPLLQHPQVVSPSIPALPLPPPPPPQAQAPTLPPPPRPPPPYSQPLPTVEMCVDSSDSDTSEYSDSPAKRRRRGGGDGGEGTSTGGGSGGPASASTAHEVGTAISKSASVIADAIQACEEREERRHRDLLSLHERRLKIEESKTEINRQGISGLVDAINKLADSIIALASHKNQSAPK